MTGKDGMTFLKAMAEVRRLRGAIRKHMNYRGDDRCCGDDHELYSTLPEGDTRPERETLVTIENCQHFIECRQSGREYVSPQRRIEELEGMLEQAISVLEDVRKDIQDDNLVKIRTCVRLRIALNHYEALGKPHHEPKSNG